MLRQAQHERMKKEHFMMNNSKYNKIKVLHDASALCWFIEMHALEDAQKAGDKECIGMLENLKKDLEKHIVTFEKHTCK